VKRKRRPRKNLPPSDPPYRHNRLQTRRTRVNPCPIQQIVKRNGALVRYDRERIHTAVLKATAATGSANTELAGSMALKVEQALIGTYGSTTMPSVEDIQDVVESVLMENRLSRIARQYIIYRNQRAMARAAKAYAFEVTDNVPYRKLYEVLRWNMDHQCESVHSLNRVIASKQFPDLVKACDERYRGEIRTAAERILQHRDKIRIVIVAGPSSSGKTTTTIKVGEILQAAGCRLKAINIDHYFFDLERHPRDEFGDYDYETPQALDLDLINTHLEDLLKGKAIHTPHYAFKTGKRTLNVHPLSLAPDEILLIDSLHGLYDGMTCRIAPEHKFKLYIETLGQFRAEDGTFMRWADNRLLRRMIRDQSHRNLQPIQTLTHWHYVRRSEIKHIIPFIKHADAIVNTALPYELPVLRPRAMRFLRSARKLFAADPKRLDAHIRANRVFNLLEPIKGVRDESCIPDDSLLREFIGGSRYTY